MPPESPSVLHVAQPSEAGVTNVAANLVDDQLARGWPVAVACPPGSELWDHAGEVGVSRLAWAATRSPGPAVPSETRRLRRAIAEAEPELVHLHSAKAGLAGRLAIRGRRPTVFQPHAWSFEAVEGVVRRATVGWERLAARWSDLVVCVSRDERLRGEAVGIRARFAEIPNGVDLERHPLATPEERAEARRLLGLGEGPVAVMLGRLFRQKGVDVLLRAWEQVRERAPGAELAIVGDGPERQALEAAAREGVRFAGKADDVGPWLAAANVVVLPSRWEAGLTLAAMEAMARGRSVVATDVAGMREGLEPDCGAVVPIDAVEPLAEALAQRLLDPERADAEGRAGRRRVEERYDLRVTSARMADAYAGVLERRG